jgi:hypothetical protein
MSDSAALGGAFCGLIDAATCRPLGTVVPTNTAIIANLLVFSGFEAEFAAGTFKCCPYGIELPLCSTTGPAFLSGGASISCLEFTHALMRVSQWCVPTQVLVCACVCMPECTRAWLVKSPTDGSAYLRCRQHQEGSHSAACPVAQNRLCLRGLPDPQGLSLRLPLSRLTPLLPRGRVSVNLHNPRISLPGGTGGACSLVGRRSGALPLPLRVCGWSEAFCFSSFASAAWRPIQRFF